jgi:uncharacterized membrane protein YebE (DUF533 family)
VKATDLVDWLLQVGISSATRSRLRHAMGARGDGQPAGRPAGAASDHPAGERGVAVRGLAEPAADFVGANRSGPAAGARSGGALPGGAAKAASGPGALAVLSGLALSALGSQPSGAGQRPAEDTAEADELEQSATLILAAMINAAKADGQVDQEELQRIVGKLRQAGAAAEAVDFVMSELRKPLDLEGLLRRVPNQQVAVQLYAASLLAIEADTEAERQYLRRLARGLGLEGSVVRHVHQCFGMEHASSALR